jgi:predicted dehydrogenase
MTRDITNKEHKEVIQPVPVMLSGFGQWVRTRTVIPLLRQYPEMMKVVAVTAVGKDEFEKRVKPQFENNDWAVPKLVEGFEEACEKMCIEEIRPLAVLVTTPNALHCSQARIALEAGYHVYVERPIVTRDDDLPALVDMADKQELLLFTGTQRRLEDPFRYLMKVVTENYGFGELKRIRCNLAAGHTLKGWRRDPSLAGGGIITDTGYHLLDIVAWLICSNGIRMSRTLDGAVLLGFRERGSADPMAVETEAVGHVKLPNDIVLSFDFTYNAPENSIYEQIELSDQDSTRVRVTRDQALRTSLPATITHQLSNGKMIQIETSLGQEIRIETIRFSGKAQNAEPVRMFIEAVRRGYRNVPGEHILSARNSIPTWHLVREIYRLSSEERN